MVYAHLFPPLYRRSSRTPRRMHTRHPKVSLHGATMSNDGDLQYRYGNSLQGADQGGGVDWWVTLFKEAKAFSETAGSAGRVFDDRAFPWCVFLPNLNASSACLRSSMATQRNHNRARWFFCDIIRLQGFQKINSDRFFGETTGGSMWARILEGTSAAFYWL